ncbi:thioredoxin-disulfide reductase [Candidatus Shikimatogenerans silvanidophilus]|uniref:thioredoxin-disulfide reductase n=1 Tax=Candidatus Shikimatogenerans silvanidophilus TaxID=2782547 RepID=UPI001BADF109|nr:thioredoxin-disulfide reductase [Candidatus Shikimatogenerans silvanidophilus]
MEYKKVVIIGSGPSGYTSAIYISRFGLNPILYTGINIGGQLNNTKYVENYPGFNNGILGPVLMEKMKKQSEKFGTKIYNISIEKVLFSKEIGKKHIIFLENGKFIETHGVIISTGSSYKKLGIKDENRFIGLGVSYCSICDGFFFKKKNVAIIGGGDTALEDALYLSDICEKVFLIVRKNYFKGTEYLQKKIKNVKNIKVYFNYELIEIIGNTKVEKIKIINNKNKKELIIVLDGIFISIGNKPNTEIFKNQIKMDKNGYIITKEKTTITNKPGVFASGDVQDPIYKQAVTAAGSGCMAAIDLKKYFIDNNIL